MQLALTDGTLLIMTGECELVLSGTGQKHIELRRGAITAQVMPQPPGKPLIVRTRSAELEVIGTAFAVTSAADTTSLNVDSGKVRMIRPDHINLNYYNMVQNGGLVEWQGNGTWTMPNVDGGTGGIGALEFRFTSDSTLNLTVRVNSTNYPLQLRGENTGWQFDHYTTARLEGVMLTAGLTNTISITQSQTLGIDSMTVSTASHLTKAQPHR